MVRCFHTIKYELGFFAELRCLVAEQITPSGCQTYESRHLILKLEVAML